MKPENNIAFKEWAVICKALGTGRQSLILRKGGIDEGQDGFRVDHHEFWLFPTHFHQAAEDLDPAYFDLWNTVQAESSAQDTLPLRQYVVVDQVLEITDETRLPRLVGQQGWSNQILQARFHYRRPGLFALLVRVYQQPTATWIANAPAFAGCRSWVELGELVSTKDLQPVLSDQEHQLRMQHLIEECA